MIISSFSYFALRTSSIRLSRVCAVVSILEGKAVGLFGYLLFWDRPSEGRDLGLQHSSCTCTRTRTSFFVLAISLCCATNHYMSVACITIESLFDCTAFTPHTRKR